MAWGAGGPQGRVKRRSYRHFKGRRCPETRLRDQMRAHAASVWVGRAAAEQAPGERAGGQTHRPLACPLPRLLLRLFSLLRAANHNPDQKPEGPADRGVGTPAHQPAWPPWTASQSQTRPGPSAEPTTGAVLSDPARLWQTASVRPPSWEPMYAAVGAGRPLRSRVSPVHGAGSAWSGHALSTRDGEEPKQAPPPGQ